MTAAFQPGAVVFVRPRLPALRFQGWSPHACWPAVVTECEEVPQYHAADSTAPLPPRWWRLRVQPSGVEDRTVLLSTQLDNVATTPCADCQAAWTAAGWQQLATMREAG